jgi:APA family basic amino acid/polyamine antiporter
LISAAIAIFTGLSYAELSSMFPKEAAEYNYTKKAFNRETLSFVVGWILAIGTVIAASTVALGFGGYFSSLTGIEPKVAALALIGAMTILNYLGIKESANFNNFSTIVEIIGLIIVIAAAFLTEPQAPVNLFELPVTGFSGIIAAISVIFFAYIGFENIVNLSEEIKDSKNIVPKALILSLGLSTVIYILVSIAAVREVGWEALSQSKAPLTLVVSRVLGQYAPLLSYIALFATSNTVLMFLIVPSRILYGMSQGKSIQKFFSKVGSRGTPYFSVAIVGLIAAFLVYTADIKTVAQLADAAVFIAYLAVNLSLIVLANSKYTSKFKSPRLFGIPIFAYLGATSAFIMIMFLPPTLWLMQLVIVGVGLAIFSLNKSATK